MRRSLYSFYLIDYEFNDLKRELEEFIAENSPNPDEENTEGFIDWEATPEYALFKYYRKTTKSKFDPAAKKEIPMPIITTISIAINRDPYMLLIFTRERRYRDRILSLLPIQKEQRIGIEFSGDFIELLNTIDENHPWYKDIMGEDIESRGRRGYEAMAHDHKVSEIYGDYSERFSLLNGKVTFREYARLVVSLEEITIGMIIYPGGRITVELPKRTDLKTGIHYIGKAINKLYHRFEAYLDLTSKQG